MGLSKATSLFIALLFSVAFLVSARELSETAEKKDSVGESKYHNHGYHGGHRHYPPYYNHHHYHRGYHHHDEHRHYPPTTERKTLESYEVKPNNYHGNPYALSAKYPCGPSYDDYRHSYRACKRYPRGPYDGRYHVGYDGHYSQQGN